MHFLCVWEETKSRKNLAERGFDFLFASMIFEQRIVAVDDRRFDYGEVRFVAVGLADGIHLTVVYTDRSVPAPVLCAGSYPRVETIGGRG